MRGDLRSLRDLAWAGFTSLDRARAALGEVAADVGLTGAQLLDAFRAAADPDQALERLGALLADERCQWGLFVGSPERVTRLLRIVGASAGLGDFLERHPEGLGVIAANGITLPEAAQFDQALRRSVAADGGFSRDGQADELWSALRTEYRIQLLDIVAYDLAAQEPARVISDVADRLSELAASALDASLSVARTLLLAGHGRHAPVAREEIEATRLAIIGMGKAGGEELNYVSDVDVIFVVDSAGSDATVPEDRLVQIASHLASLTMAGIAGFATEPALWEVDANLRPEGRDGPLVRTLASHLAYYDRWAHGWEFQALIKARPLAGDRELGARYIDALSPKIWESASRPDFVSSVQRMRERVTANIPADELQRQIKLGEGGLRDIEFTVQLLQLVHGRNDSTLRERATLPALDALADGGYIGRSAHTQFSDDYRTLRVLEHRLQLQNLERTHLMPTDEAGLRVLARSSGLTPSARELSEEWEALKVRVRGLHERLFYQPLLSVVAALPTEGFALDSAEAEARFAAIGFSDPAGALRNIRALSSGVSRRASILRNLLPVLLQWFARTCEPDYGLLAFRRISDALTESPWYVRMLRDSSGAALRVTRVLGNSRFVGELLDLTPEAVAWLQDTAELLPRSRASLDEEIAALIARHPDERSASAALRSARRREILRLAMASLTNAGDIQHIAEALTDVTESYLAGLLTVIRREHPRRMAPEILEFGIVTMGRFGGRELGFGSDADLMYVYRAGSASSEEAASAAQKIATELARLTEDTRLPLAIDLGLRPEGANGPLVRSLDSYRSYYERWSLGWEAQALLRARGSMGDRRLLSDYEQLVNTIRYPAAIDPQEIREIKRIKARVENERLPQGADPLRHLKLGTGSLSDVEWFAQLLQLEYAHRVPGLRTTSTLATLAAARDAELLSDSDHDKLCDAWILSSRLRSAATLAFNHTSDVLPRDRQKLEHLARLLDYPACSASALESDYLRITRRSRGVFEERFYGKTDSAYSAQGSAV